ncbi:MAG: hypothetical protein WBG32_12080 [Nodosilinea sp.]
MLVNDCLKKADSPITQALLGQVISLRLSDLTKAIALSAVGLCCAVVRSLSECAIWSRFIKPTPVGETGKVVGRAAEGNAQTGQRQVYPITGLDSAGVNHQQVSLALG